MLVLFWCLVLLILTHYVFFPLGVFVLSWLFPRPHRQEQITPTVSFIVAAYNEAKVIQAKLKNIEELDYPKDKLEVIIVSDGSTDETPLLVERWGKPVKSLYQPERKGKAHALNRAVEKAGGEILIFSDANNLYRPDAVRELVENFGDTKVGAVCGQKKIVQVEGRESSKGDSTYWEIESWLKEAESLVGSIATGDGEIFAVRRSLYRPIPSHIINDDMAMTLDVRLAGFRIVYEPDAISEEVASISLEDDFKVKARMVAGGYQIFAAYATVLPRTGIFALKLLVHKGLRYFMPVLLISLFLVNFALLLTGPFYTLFFVLQAAFYTSALLGWLLRYRGRPVAILYLPVYYCTMNVAALLGLFYFLAGLSPTTIWSKAKR